MFDEAADIELMGVLADIHNNYIYTVCIYIYTNTCIYIHVYTYSVYNSVNNNMHVYVNFHQITLKHEHDVVVTGLSHNRCHCKTYLHC